ncbi:MAG: ATP synthase F1 subunit delta [Bacteroidales bacterium]|nr:ATP synthase F1 subunit delta [Bacteroidales bacterium]
MSMGLIASRYAKALLKLVDETGNGELVVQQVQVLQDALGSVPELRRAVDDLQTVTPDQKTALFETVLSGGGSCSGTMAPELRSFIGLLGRNGRIGEIRLIFNSFISEYYKSRGIVRGRLVFPSEEGATRDGKALEERIRNMIESRSGKKLLLKTEVDESLIGGFLLEVEDQLLDASVSHQLDLIRKQFIERNRRIV